MNAFALSRRALLGAVLAAPAVARADAAFPSRPIRYICPFPPGATNDGVSRVMARALQARLGVPVVVENRAGAGGALGARLVAESKPDGYTLLNASAGNLTTTPHLSPVGYDPLKDFAPVALAGESFSLLGVTPALPVNSITDLVAYARAHPGVLNYGSAGIGSGGHLRGALLADEAGLDMVHVPFPGSAPAVNSLLRGDIHFLFDPVTAPHVAAGRLKGIAVLGRGRWPAFPDVPNIEESGLGRDWPGRGWFGLFAAAGTPPSIVERLNRAFNDSLADPDVEAALLRLGLRPEAVTPEELGHRVRVEHADIGSVLRRLRIA